MLGDSPLYAVIPVSDLLDARRFYEEVLGIPPVRESETEILYRARHPLRRIPQPGRRKRSAHAR
jgi:catechol 2,3-dioxygenase-like lactoylglutathione lyase family enzyme